MSNEYSLASRVAESLKEIDIKKHQITSTVIKDGSNEASFPGFPYKLVARGSHIIVNVDLFKSGYECSTCKGTAYIQVKSGFIPNEGPIFKEETCPDCNGKGSLLHLPDESKSLPCTGVVVSIGEDVDLTTISLYDRVIFGPHSGRFIPISKAGVMMKIMDQREACAMVIGGEDLSSFDFIDLEGVR